MKLSGMRDGPMKSVTVPEIPGQLGPMRNAGNSDQTFPRLAARDYLHPLSPIITAVRETKVAHARNL